MKLQPLAKIRIPILLVMTAGEIYGLLYFYGSPKFFHFIVVSVSAIVWILPLFFLDFMNRIDVKYNNLLPIQLGVVWFPYSLKHEGRLLVMIWAFVILAGLTSILNRLYRRYRTQQQSIGGRA